VQRIQPELCYLCGRILDEPVSDDHVPPKQIFAGAVRSRHSPNLDTVPVHAACNRAFQHDEDYFAATLAPFAVESYAGRSVVEDQARRLAEGRWVGLMKKIRQEIEPRPSGLVLPGDLIVKRYARPRVERVAWKIVRGLYFIQLGGVLPESTPFGVQVSLPPTDPPSQLLSLLDGYPSYGNYKAVFDFTFRRFDDPAMYLWAVLLWDRVILLLGHHDPQNPVQNAEKRFGS